MMKWLEKIIFSRMSHFLDKMAPGQIIGPLRFGKVEDQVWIEKLLQFRNGLVKQNAPYLLAKDQLNIESELKLDERSYHFILVVDGEICSSVRITPYPFECTHFFTSLDNDQYRHYFEYSRLMAIESGNGKRSYLAKWPMVKAALWLFSETNCQGIICMAKLGRIPFLEKFGMGKIWAEKTYLDQRGGHYLPLAATRRSLVINHVTSFLGIDLNKKRRNIYESRMATTRT